VPDPSEVPPGKDFTDLLNPDSLQVLAGCKLEPSLGNARPGDLFQFERQGYFCSDPDGAPGGPVFNRTVTLKDTWAKIQQKEQGGG
jgi:glutaminyl-tRNA synthetase